MKKNVKTVIASIIAVCCIVSNSFVFASADFVTEGETTKYEDSNGEFVKKKLITVDGKKYYFDEDGNMCTGFVEAKSGTYYFDENGVMQTGLKKIDGTYYYFSEKGKMATGTVVINNKYIYKFGSDGKFKSKADGWISFKSGSKYYCVKGKIQKGIVTIRNNDGTKGQYYFDKEGKLVSGKNVEYNLSTLYIGSDGEIYAIEDNSQKKRDELEKLEEEKKAYNEHIKECEELLKDLKSEQSDVKSLLDYYNGKLNKAKSNMRMVYRSDGSVGYDADYSDVAYYQTFVDIYKEKYDEYTDYIKKCQSIINDDKSEIKRIDKRISELKSEFKKAGLSI